MIISVLLVFTFFPLLIALIGFFLKLSHAVEDETLFYYIAGLIIVAVALFSFSSGIEYETGANSSVVGNLTTYTYNYTKADLQTSGLVSLSLLVLGIFLIIAGYNINNHRKKEKIENEGESAW